MPQEVTKINFYIRSAPFVLRGLDIDGVPSVELAGDPLCMAPWARVKYRIVLKSILTKYRQLEATFPGQSSQDRFRSALQIVTTQMTEHGMLVHTEHGYDFMRIPSTPWLA